MRQRRDAVLHMPKQQRWIVNPEIGLVDTLASYGRFLENDYRMAIEHMSVPSHFEEYLEDTDRSFVIIGAKSVPGATAKSVFLCLKLAGARSITVKAPTLDEYFMILNVIHHHNTQEIPVNVVSSNSEELVLDPNWNRALEEATDIVVFGGKETVDAFQAYETPTRKVWVHGPKFSFGIIRAEDLSPMNIKQMCRDFYSFYGEGCLSPKFYVVYGDMSSQQYQEISDSMTAFFGLPINEFRAKLPLTRRSELTQQFVSANYAGKFVRKDQLNSNSVFTTLYGDARICNVVELEQVSNFIDKWSDNISTIALNFLDEELCSVAEQGLVPRICNYGEMQFPGFFEQFDSVDDFDIYVGVEEDGISSQD